ncbi:MAG: NapC/NirT family cytochrome c, partial [Deltaproteobacteria bacterium]|nr:NapC/NirT family cytochrome c [Deltaproteobacteria bacterium]
MSKSPKLYQNPMSRFAGVMAIMVFIILAILLLLDYLGVRLNPIIGMLAYTLFPALLLFYLFLIPVGMYREWRRRHKQVGIEAPAFPRFDFNVKNQRVQLYVFILGTSLVGLLVLGVSFRAYEFTESVHFCSELCHKVMEPEATTYKGSPHARVECVQCHVGKGATWYVKSKLAGLYQVYATLFKKYPTPIETPIHNLRPSADTCEQCHWPSKFFGAKQIMRIHYEDDEKNTPRQFFMLVNVGGGISPTGIHWHVGQDEVYYVARDKGRQDIPWVKVKHKDGRETTYVSSDNPPTGDDIAKGELRKMDCIDCHNRPTHIFRSPRHAIDESITAGGIDRTLPYVKKIGVEVLSKEYDDNDKAHVGIRDGVFSFYKEKYPDIASSKIGL